MMTSWFSLWWWMKRTFNLAYIIEIDSIRSGLIGLYDLQPGHSAEMTLVIFEKTLRNRGIGTRAFKLFAKNLITYSLTERIIVRVNRDNAFALSFWSGRGFKETGRQDNVIAMVHCLPFSGRT